MTVVVDFSYYGFAQLLICVTILPDFSYSYNGLTDMHNSLLLTVHAPTLVCQLRITSNRQDLF